MKNNQTGIISSIYWYDNYKGIVILNAHRIDNFSLESEKDCGKYKPTMNLVCGGEHFKSICDGSIKRVLNAFSTEYLWYEKLEESKKFNEA